MANLVHNAIDALGKFRNFKGFGTAFGMRYAKREFKIDMLFIRYAKVSLDNIVPFISA